MAAVLSEQQRQRAIGVVDPEAIASRARQVSQKDREYAHYLAKMYFEPLGWRRWEIQITIIRIIVIRIIYIYTI